MNVRYGRDGHVIIITIEGPLVGEEARGLAPKLSRALQKSPTHLDFLLDLTGAGTLDSVALSHLVTIYIEAKKVDPRVEIAVVIQTERLRRLLESARMSKLFHWFDNVQDALTFLRKPPSERRRSSP